MLDEVDFMKEASNMAAFNAYLDATGNAGAVVPFVYRRARARCAGCVRAAIRGGGVRRDARVICGGAAR